VFNRKYTENLKADAMIIEHLEKNGSKTILGDILLSPFLPSAILLKPKPAKNLLRNGTLKNDDSFMKIVKPHPLA
jgi:hypothetical protein